MKFNKNATKNPNSPEFKMLQERSDKIAEVEKELESLRIEQGLLQSSIQNEKEIPENYLSEYVRKQHE